MLTQKYICILTFTTALFTIAKTWKKPEPIDRCMEKDDVIHTHTPDAHTHPDTYTHTRRTHTFTPRHTHPYPHANTHVYTLALHMHTKARTPTHRFTFSHKKACMAKLIYCIYLHFTSRTKGKRDWLAN